MQRRHTNNCLLLHSPDTRQIVNRHQRRSPGPAAVYRLCCFRLSATKQQTTVRRWRGKQSKQRLISFSSPYVSPKRSMLTFSFSSANGLLALYHMHTVWSHPLPPSPVSGYLPQGLVGFIASFPLRSLATKRAAPCEGNGSFIAYYRAARAASRRARVSSLPSMAARSVPPPGVRCLPERAMPRG